MSVFQEPDGMSCVLQDFEIAGSRTGALSTDCAGGCECETPIGTINSWDSHSHYRHRAASPDLSLYSGVIIYCDHTHLKTATGLVRVLLVVSHSTNGLGMIKLNVNVTDIHNSMFNMFMYIWNRKSGTFHVTIGRTSPFNDVCNSAQYICYLPFTLS